MAHLWRGEVDGRWTTVSLQDTVALDEETQDGTDRPGAVRIHRTAGSGAAESWLLLAAPGASVRVNGRGLPLGLRLLRDRDEIVLPRVAGESQRIYFSTERLCGVEPMPAGGKTVFCARCKQPIVPGTPAVRCPNGQCKLWHHQSEEFPCWTYAERCTMCDQPSALDAGYRWTPAGL